MAVREGFEPSIHFRVYTLSRRAPSEGKIRMDHDPGTQIPLDKNGQLVLNRA